MTAAPRVRMHSPPPRIISLTGTSARVRRHRQVRPGRVAEKGSWAVAEVGGAGMIWVESSRRANSPTWERGAGAGLGPAARGAPDPGHGRERSPRERGRNGGAGPGTL